MRPLIIVLTGTRGSGKDAVERILTKYYNAEAHNISALMRAALTSVGITPSTENHGAFGMLLRENVVFPDWGKLTPTQVTTAIHALGLKEDAIPENGYGMDLFCRMIGERINDSSSPLHVFNKARFPEDYEGLRARGEVRLFHITAPIEQRWQRVKNRGQKAEESTMSLADFIAAEARLAKNYLFNFEEIADWHYHNIGTYNNLESAVTNVMGRYF